MKFYIKTSGMYYYDKNKIDKLKRLGFEFDPKGYILNSSSTICFDDDDPELPTIEINSLDELMQLVHEYGDLIVSESEIEIYDDYRE